MKEVLHRTDHRQTYKRWEGPCPQSVHTREGVLPVLRRRAVCERFRGGPGWQLVLSERVSYVDRRIA